MSCPFTHKKARYINCLFLPPTICNPDLEQNKELAGAFEEEEALLLMEDILVLPNHPPVVVDLTLDDESDDDWEEELNICLPYKKEKTPDEAKEEELILELCRKSGEFYKMPRIHTSETLLKNEEIVAYAEHSEEKAEE
ncbi:uncharacterized protein C12orf50 homolog isoform X2 [Pelobates fuscus]